jgi:hypothetical protein
MGIDARATPKVAPDLLLELSNHLRVSESDSSFAEAIEAAIRGWIAADKQHHPQAVPHSRGYQWKSLFLPDATELRMTSGGSNFYARVIGDDIIFQGRSVSPRGMTLAIAGDGRNAWRDLWIKFPGESTWKIAICCRRDAQRTAAKPPPSPLDTMTAAAAAMSNALKSALALVEHSNALTVRKFERRGNQSRRESDVLGDVCSFD